MKKYVIIEIFDNKEGTDGHVIVVKANEVKKSSIFKHLSKMFGKEYYDYSMTETSETEYFIFPFSEQLVRDFVLKAQRAEEAIEFWEPNMSIFYDAELMLENGIKTIHKHKSFKTNKIYSDKGDKKLSNDKGIEEIVEFFKISNSLNPLFDNPMFDNEEYDNVTDVKMVHLKNGSVYSGKALMTNGICMPHGYGVQAFPSKGYKISSFFRGGGVGNVGSLDCRGKFVYIGGLIDNKQNGWGFKLSKGQFTFGYYKNGKIYKEMSPFATDIYHAIHGHLKLGHFDADIKGLAVGILPSEMQAFTGFLFLENGSVYIGECNNKNEYALTGRFIHLDIEGKATFGHFKNGTVLKRMTQQEYFKTYTSKSIGQERINTSTNYLAKPDTFKYLIVGLNSSYDIDMGPIVCVYAIPFETIEPNHEGIINFDDKQIEYFYLYLNDNLISEFVDNYEKRRLWIVNMDDFNTHFDYVQNLDLKGGCKRNFHLHNEIIGLEYSKINNFDNVGVSIRIQEKYAK